MVDMHHIISDGWSMEIFKRELLALLGSGLLAGLLYTLSPRSPFLLAMALQVAALVWIRRLALENDVPIVERKPLARALYRHVQVGQEIPPDQYAAVAEVLATATISAGGALTVASTNDMDATASADGSASAGTAIGALMPTPDNGIIMPTFSMATAAASLSSGWSSPQA